MDEEKLFSLMAVAEEQQAAIETALKAMQEERQALAEAALEVQYAISNAMPAIKRATQEAASSGVQSSLLGASEAAAEALKDTAKPLVKQMQGVVQAAGVAEKQLSSVTANFSRSFAIVAGAIAAGTIGAVLLASSWLVEKQRVEVDALVKEKATLSAEIDELKANAKMWEKKGGRAKVNFCGESNRLCVQVYTDERYGKNSDYFILRGY
jgi:hypothetical protein